MLIGRFGLLGLSVFLNLPTHHRFTFDKLGRINPGLFEASLGRGSSRIFRYFGILFTMRTAHQLALRSPGRDSSLLIKVRK